MEMVYTWNGTEETVAVVEENIELPVYLLESLSGLWKSRHYSACSLLQGFLSEKEIFISEQEAYSFLKDKVHDIKKMKYFRVQKSRTETRPVIHELRIPDYIAEAIFYLCRAQKKISAIKLLRAHVIEKKGPEVIGLKESKDFIEQWYHKAYYSNEVTLGDILAEALKGK